MADQVDHTREVHSPPSSTLEYSLDELARGLASGKISRRKALKWMGGALITAATIGGGCGEENGGAPGDQEAAKETISSDGALQRVAEDKVVYGTSFVNPRVEISGEVYIGQKSFVAGNAVLKADGGRRVEIGNQTNAQDNVAVEGLQGDTIVNDETSLAHHAIVEDSEIGDFVFVGFNAEVVNSTVGDGTFIQHGAHVEGVEIPQNAYVDVGQEVTTQEQADALATAVEATEEFRREVLEVNKEFAEGYIELYEEEGAEALSGIGPSPKTSFNPKKIEPEVPDSTAVGRFVRIVGDVRMGENSDVGERSAIRADEGVPIVIGEDADIGERVTFHALKGTELKVGNRLTAGDGAVLHGPLEVGDNLRVGERGVVFRCNVGDDVTVGEGAIIAGPVDEDGVPELEIPDGTDIPDGAVITNQEELDGVLERQEQRH
jgi:carbon dioxide concentrating mechanism protein CcmM